MIASRLIAHRGCAKLAPENTLAAMKLTKTLGVDWVEIDANLMGDGSVVIFHDDTLDRLTNRSGDLKNLVYSDVAEVNIGSHFSETFKDERILTLEAMLDVLAKLDLGLNLEIKRYEHFSAADIVNPTISAIEQCWKDYDRLIISSFDHEILKLIYQAKPDWQLGQLWEALPDDWQSAVDAINAVSVHLDNTLITLPVARAVKQAGLDLYVYTVNDLNDADRLFDMGVDGIFTDDPTIFR
ncbi:MAG: glycerophosphoryl diester phosphodiesterase [Oceanospirillales bacterium]|nr:MAG: glycerophosphoryl diester phosphodiesterase [Oceanospirillales bacterium]